MKRTNLYLLWRDRSPVERFRGGVSLHSHTHHSRENMAFVPRYLAGVPVAGQVIEREALRYRARTGRTLDFGRAFWRPPLAPSEALDLERRQIQGLGLEAMVSLSDHDDIQAGVLLSVLDPCAPVSVEWTVPFGPTFFHIGVHNLPRRLSQEILETMHETTLHPRRERVEEILAMLNEFPETLIVWNHPCWDEARVGTLEHAQLLGQFLERFGQFFHALELNGLRPWKENRQVIRVAEGSGHPLISGGDRHGMEPNANVNLTNAGSFPEFVDEIRRDRHSDVLFMTQYREPLRARMIETMWDIVRDYPEFPQDRRRWSDRVFYEHDDGQVRSMAESWKGNDPWPVRLFLRGLRAAKSQQMKNALRWAHGQEISQEMAL